MKLDKCERWDREIRQEDCYEIDCNAFAGGIAVWGALPPAFNTASESAPPGVHVHARKSAEIDEKHIDETFPAVRLVYNEDFFNEKSVQISDEESINYFVSKTLGLKIKDVYCNHCGNLHLDAGFFATLPHKKHLCNSCGRHFSDSEAAVSNPIVLLRRLLADDDDTRRFERSLRTLDVRQADYPGGIQLWASNPAIVWTAPRPEQTGVHVHLYSPDGVTREEDDTFGIVKIDGYEINEVMLRYKMAQDSMPELNGRISTIDCESCGKPHFDSGTLAFRPHAKHECEDCGHTFPSPRRKKIVSNPIHRTLEALYKIHAQTDEMT